MDGLGKVRIEYCEGGNVVQVYNSPQICSLVINGRLEAQYVGFAAGKFSLTGEIISGDKKIKVEAKMGFFNMHLFYDGKRVAKKFMGFG